MRVLFKWFCLSFQFSRHSDECRNPVSLTLRYKSTTLGTDFCRYDEDWNDSEYRNDGLR